MPQPQNLTAQQYEALFFPGMLPLLRQAFSERERIATSDDIYDKYCRVTGAPRRATQQAVTAWLARMQNVADAYAVRVQVQGRGNPRLAELLPSGNGSPLEWLWTTFYHFLNPRSSAFPTKRIYIHAALPIEQHGVIILNGLLSPLAGLMAHPGFHEAKIAGPGATGRADTIVAYFSNADTLRHALDVIKRMPGTLFQPGVPQGVLPLDYIHPGVGGADQPVEVAIEGRDLEAGSYGLALADLIYRALNDAHIQRNAHMAAPELYRRYLWVLLSLFEKGGFDPKLPYLMQADYRKA